MQVQENVHVNRDDASISAWRKKKEIFPLILVLASPGSHIRFLALALMLASLRCMCEAAFRVYPWIHVLILIMRSSLTLFSSSAIFTSNAAAFCSHRPHSVDETMTHLHASDTLELKNALQ